jgi:ssDNA thymidine ADP-ribosyltransferase, DarT
MSLSDAIAARGIRQLLHFTTNRGALGILASKAIKPRTQLGADPQLEKIFYPNASDRSRDKAWHDYVNLSISNINESFFDICANNWHRDKDFWWAVFAVSPDVLVHNGVYFATTNNMYSGVQRAKGEKGLSTLFAPVVVRWHNNPVHRLASAPDSSPTCNQAEVLYPGALSTDFVQRVYVRSDAYADELAGQIAVAGHGALEILVDPSLFGAVK